MNREQRRKLAKERKKRQNDVMSQGNKVKNKSLHERLAPSGISGELHLIFRHKDENLKDMTKLKDNSLRAFKVTLYFKKDYVFSGKIDAGRPNDSGSSFLSYPKDAISLKIESGDLTFDFFRNIQNEASSVTTELLASTSREAMDLFIAKISPILDHLSYFSDRPFFYDEIHVLDTVHQTQVINYTSPYLNFVFGGFAQLHNEMLPIYSLYREAKNTVSPFYKIFCYSKIMEGIVKSIRPTAFKKIKELKIDYSIEKELIPDHEEFRLGNLEHIGKPIIKLYENEFQKDYRDAMAHFALDERDPINLSNYSENSRFSNKVFLFETACRILIGNTEKLLDVILRHKVA